MLEHIVVLFFSKNTIRVLIYLFLRGIEILFVWLIYAQQIISVKMKRVNYVSMVEVWKNEILSQILRVCLVRGGNREDRK